MGSTSERSAVERSAEEQMSALNADYVRHVCDGCIPRDADTARMATHEMKRFSGPAGGAWIVECTCGWLVWTKADTPETSIESTIQAHIAERLIDG